MSKKEWGPGAPKVPLNSDLERRDRLRAKRQERQLRRAEKFAQSQLRLPKGGRS